MPRPKHRPLAPETLSYAQAAVRAVQREMLADPRVVVLGEDVGRGGIFGQYAGLQQQFGAARVIDTPISEAAIMGAGVGMALAGMRPIVEMRVVDFALCGMDEIVNQAAKNRFMFGGQGRVPLVARMPGGIWDASAAQHSQSLEAWFAHLPGLVVVCPSTPQDNYSLLRAALQSGDPVVYIEHKTLWGSQGAVDEALAIPLGQAAVRRRGSALTMVSWSRQALLCEQACDALGGRGYRCGADRPALHLAVGPRAGARLLRPDRPPAGGTRSGAGRRLWRRDCRHRCRGHGLPDQAPGRTPHPGGLRAGAGGAVAHRCGCHHRCGAQPCWPSGFADLSCGNPRYRWSDSSPLT
jgi:pyruvate/2-oxoglutarate/acetoin dehydrogenase E1 component